jgi:flagellar biosynthetic protein FliS
MFAPDRSRRSAQHGHRTGQGTDAMHRTFERLIGGRGGEMPPGEAGERAVGPAAAYRAIELATATPPRLAERLYDGAIGLCQRAVEALDGGDFERAADRLTRAQGNFHQLQRSFEVPEASPRARRLADLCRQVRRRLVEADFYRRREAVNEAISLLVDLRPDWSALGRIARSAVDGGVGPGPAESWLG